MDERVGERGGRIGNAMGTRNEMTRSGGRERKNDNANANFEFRVAIYTELSPTFVTHANGTRAPRFFHDARKTTGTTTATTTGDSRRAVTFF